MPQQLHLFLGIGLTVVACVSVILSFVGVAPLMAVDDASRLVGRGLASVAIAILLVAVVFMKRRVPERRGGEPIRDYWTRPEVVQPALLVWFLIEGAGILASVAFALTAVAAAAGVMALCVAAYWWIGPNAFARA